MVPKYRTIMFLLIGDPWFWDTCSDEQAEAVLDSALAQHISGKSAYAWLEEKED